MQRMLKLLLLAVFILPAFTGRAQKLNYSIYDLMERTDLSITEVERLAQAWFNAVGTERGSGYKQYQRWLYERKFHLNSQGYFINATTEMAEFERATASMPPAFPQNPLAAFSTWTELGPKVWNRTSGWNPGVGRLTAMAIHPANQSIIYVGSPGGGMWKTTNSGTTWTPMSDANSAWMHIYALEIDPNNQNIVYAGTGNSANIVLKSTNAGASWSVLGAGPTGFIRRIIVNPSNSSIVLAAASNGIWRSTNGGTSWTQVHSTSYKEDLEFKPGDPNTVYASGNDVWRSTNNGVTWTQVTAAAGITNNGRCLIGVSPANASYVYIVQANGSEFGRMYRSTNSGVSFTTTVVGSAGSGTNYFGYTGSTAGGQAGYDMAICVSNTNINEVHIAGIICWKSTNGGTSFVIETEWFLPNSTGYNHADVHGLHYVGNNIYSLSDGGIYKSTDFGDNWTDLSTGLGIRQFYRMANSQTNATVITGGAQDNGSSALTPSGWRDWLGADGMEGLVSPTNANNLWGTSQNGQLYRSTDMGLTRINLTGTGGPWVTNLAQDPVNENILYIGWNAGLQRSTNGGSTWASIAAGSVTSATNEIAVAPGNGAVIYAAIGSTIWVTTNTGASWVARTSPGGTVNDICVSPTNSNKIWVAAGNTVHVSTNGGLTFTNLSAGLPAITCRAVVVDNTPNEGLYVGMNIGVYYRNNIVTAWANGTGNLPLVAINELEIQNASRKLRVATYGRGIWETDLVAPQNLYIKDRPADNGTEPFTDPGGVYWASEDIWVRNANDAGLGHQNPVCGVVNFIKVRVRNLSATASLAVEQLKVYWAKASSALSWQSPWTGGVLIPCNPASPYRMGNPVGTQNIPAIPALSSTVLTFQWTPPPPSAYACLNPADQFHFCLLARIEDYPAYPHGMTFPEQIGQLVNNVKNNNNVAWKNVSVATTASCFRTATAANAPANQHSTVIMVEGEKLSGQKTNPATLRVSVERERLIAMDEGAAGEAGIIPVAFIDENQVPYQMINANGTLWDNGATVDVGLDEKLLATWDGTGVDIMKFEEPDPKGVPKTWIRLLTPAAEIAGLQVEPDQQSAIVIRITQEKDLPDPAFDTYDFDINLLGPDQINIGGNNFRATLLATLAKTAAARGNGPQVTTAAPAAGMVKVTGISATHIDLQASVQQRFTTELMNASGQVLRRGSFTGRTQISVRDLPKGVYYVRLVNTQTNERIIKKIALQ